jgi:hypothetical protein
MDSKCVVNILLDCPLLGTSSKLNCHTPANLLGMIWAEVDIAMDSLAVSLYSVPLRYEGFGDKTLIKRLVGMMFADISTGAMVSEEPWCNPRPAWTLVEWAPYTSIVIVIYAMIFCVYANIGKSGKVSIPSSPLDGAKQAQIEAIIEKKLSQPILANTDLFGIKYQNGDLEDNDTFGITHAPQPYRRPLIRTKPGIQNTLCEI